MAPSVTSIALGSKDCWDAAYEVLDGRNPKLITIYKTNLADTANSSRVQTVPVGRQSHAEEQAALQEYLQKHTEDAKRMRMVVKFRDKEWGLRDTIDKILKATIFAQSPISQAVSGEPHAALAWAGVSLLLTVSCFQILAGGQ